MPLALAFLKRYPKQIESGLAAEYPGRHIREWHQGRMSSRELLTLIEGMSPDSWFKASALADSRAAAAREKRADIDEAHAEITARLMGEKTDPFPMTVQVVEKKVRSEAEAG